MILIVDDYADAAEALRRLIKAAGYHATVALSGRAALATIRAHPPTDPLLVVLDDMMPGMGGIEVLRAIRADPAIAGTPVIFCTANFDGDRRDEALAAGAAAWLVKGGLGRGGMDDMVAWIVRSYEKVGGSKSLAKSVGR